MSDLTGRQLDGRYRLDALLGEGGMGAVYRAHHLKLERAVAVKVMHPHLARRDQFQQRFLQEAQAAARLSHPSIVRIHDFAQEGDLLYLVMEYVPGGSLGAYLKRLQEQDAAVQLDEILYLLAQVADALDYAHRQGIVHRDVKPDNVLLKQLDRPDREGEPALRAMITDFGLAKLLEGGVQTATNTFLGTLPYLSPEQALGKELDGRSDLYSLGVILYRLATGRLPFDVGTPTEAVNKHLHDAPPPPLEIRPELPAKVAAIIHKALAKDPADRFQEGATMARALRLLAVELTPEDVTHFAPPQSVHSVLTDLESQEPPPFPSRMERPDEPPAVADQLLVGRSKRTPQLHRIEGDALTLGRTEENDVPLPGTSVSRRHAQLQRVVGGWQVVDLGSTNGTFLDGERLPADVAVDWSPDQDLRIGPYYLQWQPGAGEERAGDEERTVVKPPKDDGRTVVRPVPAEADDPATVVKPSASTPEKDPAPSPIPPVAVQLEPQTLSITPGEETAAQATLSNPGTELADLSLSVEGIPEAWVTMPWRKVQLAAGDETDVPLIFSVPAESDLRAGTNDYRFLVTTKGEQVATASAQLTVEGSAKPAAPATSAKPPAKSEPLTREEPRQPAVQEGMTARKWLMVLVPLLLLIGGGAAGAVFLLGNNGEDEGLPGQTAPSPEVDSTGDLVAEPTAIPSEVPTEMPAEAPTEVSTEAPREDDGLGTEDKPIIMSYIPVTGAQAGPAGSQIAEMISERTGLVVEARSRTDFSAVREALGTGQAHIGWLNVFNYVLANEKYDVDVALVTRRFGSTTYSGQINVNATAGIETLEDLKGKVMCWVAPNSTSGYIIPHIMLRAEGINPTEDFAQTLEVGSHSNVIMYVYNGECDAGATFSQARSLVEQQFPDVYERVTVLAETRDVPNDNISFIAEFPEEKRQAVVDALLNIADTEEGHKALNDLYSIEGLQEVEDSFYDAFRADLNRAGISIEELIES